MELKSERELQLLFLLALLCVCSSDECLHTKTTPKTPNIGDTLRLDCPCSGTDFKLDWYYRSGVNAEETVVSRGGLNEYDYTFVVWNASFGGVYRCACAESCPVGECSECFNVSVKPTISSFTIQPPIARVGMPITLMCNATGYPDPVLQNFQLTKVNPSILLPPLQKTSGGVTVTVNATLDHNGTFKCLVSNTVGHDVANFTAIVYEPPVIVSVENFTVSNFAMHSIAAIKCKVKNDSTAVNVRWTRNGRSLKEGPNILFGSYLEADVIQYVLTIHKLSKEYIGEYQCVAGSRFNDTDDVRSVWILENTTSVNPANPPSADSPTNSTHPGIVAGVVVAVFVAVAAIVVVIFASTKLYQHYYGDRGFDCSRSSSNTAGNGVSESSHHTSTSMSYNPTITEHDNTLSYTDTISSSSSRAHEGDLISLSDQNSENRSSCVSIPMDLNLENGKRKGLTQEALERLRRRPLSTPDMGLFK